MSKRSLYTENPCWYPNASAHSPVAHSSASVHSIPARSIDRDDDWPPSQGKVYESIVVAENNIGLIQDRMCRAEHKLFTLRRQIQSDCDKSHASVECKLATMESEVCTMIDQKIGQKLSESSEKLTEKLTIELARMELSLKESAVAEIRKQKSNVYERLEKRVSKIETEVAMLSAQHKSDQERLALWKAGAEERIKKLEDLYNTTLSDAKRISAGCAKGLVKFGKVLDEQQKSNNLTRISFEQRMDRMDVNLKKLIDGMKEVRDIAIQSSLAQSVALLSLGD